MNRRAITTIAIASGLDIGAGLGFAGFEHISVGAGCYWAITTATTVGYGDIVPHTLAGHLIAIVVMLTVIPLFAATFSLVTTGLTATHVRREGERIRAHAAEGHRRLDHIIFNHPDIPPLSTDRPSH